MTRYRSFAVCLLTRLKVPPFAGYGWVESGFFHYLPERQPVFTFLFRQLALCHEHGFFCDVGFPARWSTGVPMGRGVPLSSSMLMSTANP